MRSRRRRATIPRVAVELARRLMQSGVVAEGDIEQALVDAISRGVPFVAAFAGRGPVEAQLVERELARAPVPTIHTVHGIPELVASLPRGMCSRLLAVPVRRDPRTGTVDVAAADPLQTHIAAEFVFQLGAPVRVLRAPLAEVRAALELLEPGPIPPERVVLDDEPDDRTPAFGSAAVSVPDSASRARVSAASEPPNAHPSAPPIPLVRRSLPPPRWSRKGTNPGVGKDRLPVLELPEQDEAGQPVIGLFRSKVPPPPVEEAPASGEAELGLALMEVAAAETPDAVVDRLIAAMLPVADRVVVLAARSDGFGGRAASRSVGDPERVRALRVAAGVQGAIEAAVQMGYYLGRLDAAGEGALATLLGLGQGEAYVVPVVVSGRPALVLAAAGMESAFSASRRADQLAHAAAEALEHIVRARKRAGG